MLSEIRKSFDAMIALYPERSLCIIPEKDGDFPFPDQPNDWAEPFIEVRGATYHFIARERGRDCRHEATDDPQELVHWIHRDYTLWLASRYELRHRLADEDSRRQWMALHVRLLRRANNDWAERMKRYYEEILLRSPFNDKKLSNHIEENRYEIPMAPKINPTSRVAQF